MKKKKNNEISPTKSFLINVLYHAGFNKEGIKIISGASPDQIKKSVIK
tara:strand:- start:2786 stop:2929 length:144 start_codon:yes stop_codon:yes gene_type:complete